MSDLTNDNIQNFTGEYYDSDADQISDDASEASEASSTNDSDDGSVKSLSDFSSDDEEEEEDEEDEDGFSSYPTMYVPAATVAAMVGTSPISMNQQCDYSNAPNMGFESFQPTINDSTMQIDLSGVPKNVQIVDRLVSGLDRQTSVLSSDLPAHLNPYNINTTTTTVNISNLPLPTSDARGNKKTVAKKTAASKEGTLYRAPQPSVISQPISTSTSGPTQITPVTGGQSYANNTGYLVTNEPGESEQDFLFRLEFENIVKQHPELKMNNESIIAYSKLMINRIKHGVKYEDAVEKVLDYIAYFMKSYP